MIDPLKNTRSYLIGDKFKIGDVVKHRNADTFKTPFMSCVCGTGVVIDLVQQSSLVEYLTEGHPTYFLFFNSVLDLVKREMIQDQQDDTICLKYLKEKVKYLQKELVEKEKLIQSLTESTSLAYDVHKGKSLKTLTH
jgi:hypothetical protein